MARQAMIDELKNYRADSPLMKRIAVTLLITASVLLFALASTSLPNPDATVHSSAVEQPLYKGLVDGSSPSAPTPLGCTKLHRGQWLRVEIQHRGDREPKRLECFYGYGPQWQAL